MANWQVQKEPSDAQLPHEAAIAANDPGVAKPVLDFIKKTSLRDAKLAWVGETHR